MKINILEPSIFNKIAAGEVVEKPASIVKELVENSIDAGAKNITIEIEQGGITYIRVKDDGCGIEKEDIVRAFLPHATSKIKTVEDLAKIGTLGFRGEALASISAVSDVEMDSKTEVDDGKTVKVIDGIIGEIIDKGCASGTTITVTNLFKNIPARAKFLRKPKQEENDITTLVSKLIMANPEISFRYFSDGKEVYFSSGNSLKDAIYSIYDRKTVESLIEIERDFGDYKIYGFIGKPTFSKANRTYQSLNVNGRAVTNILVSTAIANAYKPYLMKGQFPFFVLHLTMPDDEVDVNVHPTKSDVKFLHTNSVYAMFLNTCSDFLLEESTKISNNVFVPDSIKAMPKEEILQALKSNILNNETSLKSKEIANQNNVATKTEKENCEKHEEKQNFDFFENKKIINENKNNIKNDDYSLNNHKNKEENIFENNFSAFFSKTETKSEDISKIYDTKIEAPNKDNELLKKYLVTEKELTPRTLKSFVVDEKDEQLNLFSDSENKNLQFSSIVLDNDTDCKIVGTVFDTYILIEKGETLFVIDQHAAHERLLFDKLTKQIDSKKIQVQQLLIPYNFNLSRNEVQFFEEHIENFNELGFEIDQIGNDMFSIKSVPLILNGINLDRFIAEVLSEINYFSRLRTSDLVLDKLKSMSCKSAIKAGYKISEDEIKYLVNLTETNNTTLMCPHGRPSVIKLSKKDFEKWFKRAV